MKKPKIHIGPVAEGVLSVIAVAGVISIAVCAPNALQALAPFFKKKKYSGKQAVERSIESLVRTGLVKKVRDAHGNPALRLTPRGEWESRIRSGGSGEKGKKWDGSWRIVIFDVPNVQNKLRAELTRGMKLYGFQLLQKSVWIYPHPCDDFVSILRSHLELGEGVVYCTVSKLENDKRFRQSFKV